jgi:hypothetical protein
METDANSTTPSPTPKRLEPWDELSEESLRKVRTITDAVHKATDNMEYNLQTDTNKVSGQNWACVSFVSPTGNQKCTALGMKIRGVFEYQEEAVEYVKRLIRLDPTFDIFVCEMYNWCLVPPDPEMITNQTYQDETLNSIISEYRKNQIYAKEHFEERKRELIEQAADEARRAAIKRMEDERNEIRSENQSEMITDITETVQEFAPFSQNGESDTVSASDVMNSMV